MQLIKQLESAQLHPEPREPVLWDGPLFGKEKEPGSYRFVSTFISRFSSKEKKVAYMVLPFPVAFSQQPWEVG